jgi:vesicle coat complex subunit
MVAIEFEFCTMSKVFEIVERSANDKKFIIDNIIVNSIKGQPITYQQFLDMSIQKTTTITKAFTEELQKRKQNNEFKDYNFRELKTSEFNSIRQFAENDGQETNMQLIEMMAIIKTCNKELSLEQLKQMSYDKYIQLSEKYNKANEVDENFTLA